VETNFIRERVSSRGLIRPLESESELPALQLEEIHVGAIHEHSLERYREGKAKYEDEFSSTLKRIKKERTRSLELANKGGKKPVGHLESRANSYPLDASTVGGVGATAGPFWNLSWPLDESETPPPSSIASRRNTRESVELAVIADHKPEKTTGGDSTWQHLVESLRGHDVLSDLFTE
jgi:hypothetical protein